MSASTLAVGQQAVLIINDGADAISGSFSSHPEGSYVVVGGGIALRVTYVMGTGNDFGVVAGVYLARLVTDGATVATRRFARIR